MTNCPIYNRIMSIYYAKDKFGKPTMEWEWQMLVFYKQFAIAMYIRRISSHGWNPFSYSK